MRGSMKLEIAFRIWLIEFDSRVLVENRHVLLTLDNCSAYNIDNLKLTNVKIAFFSANMASRLQLLDQSIIAIVKKKLWTTFAIQRLESKQLQKALSVLEALRFIALAWKSVPAEHMKNCFDNPWTRS